MPPKSPKDTEEEQEQPEESNKERPKTIIVRDLIKPDPDEMKICTCEANQICLCNCTMILEALMEYNRIYDKDVIERLAKKLELEKFEMKEAKRKEEEAKNAVVSETDMCRCAEEEVCTCESYMLNVRFFMRYKLIFAKKYSLLTNVEKLKIDFSNFTQIPVEYLQLLRWHVFLDDRKTLEHLDPVPGEDVDVVVVNTSRITPPQLEDNVVPDIITVHIADESGDTKDVTVEIEDRSIQKPFLGGHTNKESGLEYHHATTQSGPRAEYVHPYNKFHRDTQTVETRNRYVDQSYSRATQMNNENTFIPNVTDVVLTAKPYETAEERAKRLDIEGKVRIIQRYYRAWKLRKALKRLHFQYLRLFQNQQDEENERNREFQMSKIREINAKTFPRTRDDFRMLYSMVDRWKKAQIARISKNCSGAAKIAEFYLVLNREIEMLTVIEQHRQRVKEEMKDVKLMKFFNEISEPVMWKGYKNKEVAMDTIETQQGREYKRIFYEACDHTRSVEARLTFLKYLREKYLRDHNCILGNQILTLVHREEELLKHEVDENALDMLRKRIEQLLLRHMNTPECNNGVTKRKMKLAQEEYEEDSSFCPRCSKIKPHRDFPPLNCRHMAVRSCTSCTWYDRAHEPWYEVGPYRMMLRQIRRDERKRENYTSFAYIIDEKDIRYIVQRIWHARSMINEATELSDLRLCRWNKEEEWSPWNTILLTSKEVESHLKVKNLEEVYDEEFRIAVMDKNLLGRVVFSNALLLNDEFLRKSRMSNFCEQTSFDENPVDLTCQ